MEDLRRAIDSLPRHTRVAMLQGIDANRIIVGAYATSEGVCPMLAAHRAGGRTAAISFARAWDRVAFRDTRRTDSRPATERELLILRSHLEASLLDDARLAAAPVRAGDQHTQLSAGLAPPRHQPAQPPARTASPSTTQRPGDPNRAPELRGRGGWAWSRIVRRHDDYERVLAYVRAAPDTEAQRVS